MKNTTKDFIATVVGLSLGMLISVVFIRYFAPERIEQYVINIMHILVGYTWCLLAHSKAINNEEH